VDTGSLVTMDPAVFYAISCRRREDGLTKKPYRRPFDRSRRRRDFISTRAAYRIEGTRRASLWVAMAQLPSHRSCEVVADALCTVAAL